ncbi:hypothetical protein SUDANB121_03650 [Nocardiopsis dassonvillei]|uniref:ankyrin repeat domain-containing protein n=1 Tax=Nocardiopsis dassonvillei TaxID=2014 RepID=UPI003F54EC4D
MKAAGHPSKAHRPMRAAGLRMGRRYGVPRAMIERAAARRAVGDWLGACAAADVAVDLDLRALRRAHGAEFTGRLLDDLQNLVPDLVRWHFPRLWHGDGRLLPGQRLLLSRPGGAEGPWLAARQADRLIHGHRRLVLSVVEHSWEGLLLERCESAMRVNHWENVPHIWETSRYLWDARRVHEARERWGGSADRAPFLNPDGTPRTTAGLPTADPGPTLTPGPGSDLLPAADPGSSAPAPGHTTPGSGHTVPAPGPDPATRTERIDGLHRAGRVAEAFAAAGIALDTAPVEREWGAPVDPVEALSYTPLSVARLSDEVARLSAAGHGDVYWFPYDADGRFAVERAPDGSLSFRLEAWTSWEKEGGLPVLPEVCRIPAIDVDVVRDGLSPDELHPLVREALAPARPPADGPVGPPPWTPPADPVRVRCNGEWHTLSHADGRLTIPHTAEERGREAALRALGGTPAGCHAVLEAWTTGPGRLPRALARSRDDLFQRVRHGDTDALAAYLDAGGDPRVRDRGGRTLLHHLHLLDHGAVLPRLLAGGADLEARDGEDQTALFRIARLEGPPELGRALLEAGARTADIGGDGRHGNDLAEAVEGLEYRGGPHEEWSALVEEFCGGEEGEEEES